MLLNRDLLKITIQDKPLSQELVLKKKAWVKTNYNLSDKALDYFVFSGRISNTAYNEKQQNINIIKKNGELTDVA